MSAAATPLNPLVEKIRAAHPGAYDDMDDATLTKRVLAKYPQYSDLAGPGVPKPQVDMQTSALGKAVPVGKAIGDVTQGIGEGAFSTVANVGKMITDPIVKHIASPEAMARSNRNIRGITTPDNATQSAAKTGEQIGEFFTPTGLEGEAAAAAPKLLKPFARMGAAAIDTGIKNKAQGGDFTTGAAGGAGGELIGMGLQKAAPIVAETALGVTGKMRGNGRTIGKAILDETNSVRPISLAKETGEKLGDLTNQLERRTSAFSGVTSASTNPANAVLDKAISNAPRNAQGYVEKLQSLRKLLDFNPGSGPQRRAFTPDEILEMKRGVDKEISSWSPEIRKGVEGVKKQIYRALDSELDRTVPGAQDLNQRISSLIPAQKRANAVVNNASTAQRMLGRIARPTGALAGAGVGAGIGYERGGLPGAVQGGIIGLGVPELLSSPTAQMMAARRMHAPGIPITGAKAIILQADRDQEKTK